MGEKFASSILAIGKIPLKNRTFLKSSSSLNLVGAPDLWLKIRISKNSLRHDPDLKKSAPLTSILRWRIMLYTLFVVCWYFIISSVFCSYLQIVYSELYEQENDKINVKDHCRVELIFVAFCEKVFSCAFCSVFCPMEIFLDKHEGNFLRLRRIIGQNSFLQITSDKDK